MSEVDNRPYKRAVMVRFKDGWIMVAHSESSTPFLEGSEFIDHEFIVKQDEYPNKRVMLVEVIDDSGFRGENYG